MDARVYFTRRRMQLGFNVSGDLTWGQIRETTSKTLRTQGKWENFEKTRTQGIYERRE
jgi:hypothetical protein